MTSRASRYLAACAALTAVCGSAGAQRPAETAGPAAIRFVVLPSDQVSQLGRDWQPVSRAEFDKLVQEARPAAGGPSGVGVLRAVYEATFSGDSLIGGRLTATVRRQPRSDSWLNLGRVNLAISELRQGTREVNWGSAAGGRVMAHVPDDSLPLSGAWSLSGERIGRRSRFVVRLIPAAASELRILLPRDFRLEASAGMVSGPHASGDAGRKEWRIVVSTAASTSITVIPPEAAVVERPVVLLESDLTYVVRDNSLQIQLRALPEVLQKGVDSLSFRLPEGVRVYSADYGGNSPLDFVTRRVAGARRLTVRFPDPLLGRGRAVIISAVAPVRLNQSWELPKIEATGTLFVPGQVHVQLERPLELRSLTTTGLRPTAGLSRSATGESLSFESRRADAGIRVHVSRPEAGADCRGLTRFTLAGDQWNANSEFTWTARGGALFSVRCTAQAGWQIGSVLMSTSLSTDAERPITWTELPSRQGRRNMTFDLPSGIPNGESVTLRFAARRPGRSRRSRLRWPLIAPLEVDRFESVVIMPRESLPQPVTVPAGFRRLYAEDVPDYVKRSKLWQAAAADDKPVAFHTRSTATRTPLYLGRPEPGFDATGWTRATPGLDSIREEFHLTIAPQNDPVDTVLVYLSRRGLGMSWSQPVDGSGSVPLRAVRLPDARHAAWKLPAGGELWEIKTRDPLSRPFVLHAARERALDADRGISLPFLPQARKFVGHVETAAGATGLRFSGNDDLFPIGDPSAVVAQRPAGKGAARLPNGARVWRYRTARATLSIDRTGRARISAPRSPAAVEMWSVLSAAAGGRDAHRIVYRLPAETGLTQFVFTLDEAAALRAVLLDGRPAVAIRDGNRRSVPALPPGAAHTVELRYTVPSSAVGWTTGRRIVVPRCERAVGDFRWQFALPPHAALTAGPAGLTSGPLAAPPTWRTRLFGPLARSERSPIFNPLSEETWRQLLELANPDARPSDDRSAKRVERRERRVQSQNANGHSSSGSRLSTLDSRLSNGWSPRGWTVHTAVGIDVPEDVSLQISNRDRRRLWSWIGLLSCLIGGWLVRRGEFRKRRKFGAVWLSACLAAAIAVPAEFAEFAGACLAGTLIATVLSRRLVRRDPVRDQSAPLVPPGSTVSYPRVITTASIVVAAAWFAADLGQAGGQDPTKPAPAVLDRNSVVIPAPAGGEAAGSSPLVYAQRELLDALKSEAVSSRPPQYLLRRGDYQLSVVAEDSADVSATYDVVVLPGNGSVGVLLPIRDAALCGASACRVDGEVRPVRRDPAGRGFIVDIPRRRDGKQNSTASERRTEDEGRKSEVRGRKSEGGGRNSRLSTLNSRRFRPEPTRRETPAKHRIELCLQARVESARGESRVRFRIPRIASGRLELDLPFDDRPVAVSGVSSPQRQQRWFSQTVRGRLEPSDLLDAQWGDRASGALRQPTLKAQVFGLADVGAEKIRVRYFVRYNGGSAAVNSVAWDLPRSWIVRSVTLPETGQRAAVRRMNSQQNGRFRLRIDLPASQRGPFALAGEFVVPLRRRPEVGGRKSEVGGPDSQLSTLNPQRFRLSLPRLHSAVQVPSTVARIEETASRFAVASNAEFGITVAPSDPAALRAIDRLQLADFRQHFAGSRTPEFAYEVLRPTALTGSIRPHTPRRTVQQTQTGRIAVDLLHWTVTADVTVDGAPAYRHDLQIDPRLTVDSVQVLQDGAPRLVRWTRIGNRVHLFLSDKASATQKVELHARMPVRPGVMMRLPDVRFLDAATSSSGIRLRREHGMGVTVRDAGDWERPAGPVVGDDANDVPVADFRLPPGRAGNPRPPQILPDLRPATLRVRRLAVLQRTSQNGWTVECTLEFRDELEPSACVVVIPAEIAGRIRFDNQFTLKRELPSDADFVRLLLRPVLSNGKFPPLTFRFPLPPAGARRWDLPLPAPDSVPLQQDVLAVVPDGATAEPVADAEKVRLNTLPSWMTNRLGERKATVYRRRGGLWQLTAAAASSRQSDQRARFVETHIWLADDGSVQGSTQAWIAGAGKDVTRFRWPDGSILRSVRVNGLVGSATVKVSDGALNVPLDSRSLDFIRIDWSRKADERLPTALGIPVPSPDAVGDSRPLVTMVNPRSHSLFRVQGMDSLDAVEYACGRIERLLDVAAREAPRNAAAGAAAVAAERTYKGLLRFLMSPAAEKLELDAETRHRLRRIDSALKRAREAAGANGAGRSFARSAGMPILPGDADAGEVRYGEMETAAGEPGPEVQFWRIGRWWPVALLALAVLLISLPLARPLFRVEIGERLAHWEPLSWVILGIIWWLFLVPSVAGLALFCVAVAKLVRRWLRRRAAGNVIQLYDLSKSRVRQPGRS